jgi:leucyl-tRNA synthetase
VLITYGTGALLAVPAHDERDFAFAKQFKLPIRTVVKPPSEWLKTTAMYKDLAHLGGGGSELDVPQTVPMVAGPLMKMFTKLVAQGLDALQIVEQIHLEEPGLFSECFTGEGTAVNSGSFDGLPTAEFKKKITAWLQERGQGQGKVNYKLRDWLFSRQRYWGEPFPLLHELDESGRPTGSLRPLDVSELPLTLPDLADYKPTGQPEPPLEKATDWLYVTRDGKRYRRETNTMPQWAGSCWYYLRYIDSKNDRGFCDPAKERHWMPVDLYVGGAEHAVLHLLYARFWHKVLFDRGHVHTPEPFQRLVNQGMILGEVQYHVSPEVYQAQQKTLEEKGMVSIRVEDEDKVIYILTNRATATEPPINLSEEQVEKRKGTTYLTGTDIELTGRAEKMSKSRNNVVNPNDVVEEYGADSLRLYEMAMGPLEAVKPWSLKGVEGPYRFLNRVWRLMIDDRADDLRLLPTVQDIPPDKETLRHLHRTIKKVTHDLDMDVLGFNTAIAAMMEFSNHLTGLKVRPRSVLEPFVLILSPFAPHLGEELWQALGHDKSLAYEPWPTFDEALCKEDEIEVPVQINGKVRTKLKVPAGIDKAALEKAALADDKVQAQLQGKQVQKVIVVPGKLVNIVVG